MTHPAALMDAYVAACARVRSLRLRDATAAEIEAAQLAVERAYQELAR